MMALISGFLLSVFTFQTKFGTVELELPHGADATAIRVAIEKEGETVRVMEPSGRWTIKVEAGRYDTKLLSGDEQFELVDSVLTVKSGEKSVVRIRRVPADTNPQPDIEELFRIGQYQQAAKLAEREAERNPDERPNHGRAAVMWLYISLQDQNDKHAEERYDFHRNWLADRWARTGEAPRTIPRICCMRRNPPGDLNHMLAAIAQESKHYPEEAWQYSHSRMIVLYRLQRYEQALETFHQCRQLAPRDRMRAAVDHLWAANILNRLHQVSEASQDLQKGLQLLHEAGPRDGNFLSSKLFDFIESHAALEEASKMSWETPQAFSRFLPYSLCNADFRLNKWRPMSEEIMGAAVSENETTAAFALGWCPGTWEAWDLTSLDQSRFVLEEDRNRGRKNHAVPGLEF